MQLTYHMKHLKKAAKVAIFRKEHFNAAHRLYNKQWSDEKNDAIFGKASNANYHGHNYELIVGLVGAVNPNTGYVFDIKQLSNIIKKHVIKRFDHKNLNLDLEYFEKINPTAENIAIVIWKILRDQIDSLYELKITLYQNERNYVEYPG